MPQNIVEIVNQIAALEAKQQAILNTEYPPFDPMYTRKRAVIADIQAQKELLMRQKRELQARRGAGQRV